MRSDKANFGICCVMLTDGRVNLFLSAADRDDKLDFVNEVGWETFFML